VGDSGAKNTVRFLVLCTMVWMIIIEILLLGRIIETLRRMFLRGKTYQPSLTIT
jgi:hypothetical protein